MRAYHIGTHGDGCISGGAGVNATQEAGFDFEFACYLSSRVQVSALVRLPGQREPIPVDGLSQAVNTWLVEFSRTLKFFNFSEHRVCA